MKSTISFDDPPIQEVVLGRKYLPREDFLLPYFGAFWAQVRGEFPKTQHAAPIIDAAEDLGGVTLLPRVWFISKDDSRLIQLQQDRFHYNWRHTGNGKEYVRFTSVQSECLALWEKLEKYVLEVTGRPLQPVRAELTYTNYIEIQGVGRAFEVAEQALLDVTWMKRDRFLPPPKAFAHNYTFELPDGKNSLTVVATAVRRKDSEAQAIKFELTVKGACKAEDSFEEWSNTAHDFLVSAFKDLTTPSMHTIWRLRES